LRRVRFSNFGEDASRSMTRWKRPLEYVSERKRFLRELCSNDILHK